MGCIIRKTLDGEGNQTGKQILNDTTLTKLSKKYRVPIVNKKITINMEHGYKMVFTKDENP